VIVPVADVVRVAKRPVAAVLEVLVNVKVKGIFEAPLVVETGNGTVAVPETPALKGGTGVEELEEVTNSGKGTVFLSYPAIEICTRFSPEVVGFK
jgi:DNA-binding sugar fermentation-stimulating protein